MTLNVRKTRVPRDEQTAILNTMVKCRIAPSDIHGVGVFAIRDIEKGQKLYSDIVPSVFTIPYSSFGKLFPEVKELLLERFPHVVNGSAFVWPDTRLQAYMNHSDDPNYDAINDVTLKQIKTGEEVTEDYRKIESWEKVYPWLT